MASTSKRVATTSHLAVDEKDWADFKKWWIGSNTGEECNRVIHHYEEHPLLLPAMNVTRSSIFVIDIKAMRYIYLSPNFEEFIGWDKKKYIEGGVEFVFSCVHPNDVAGVLVFSELIGDYFKRLPQIEKELYRCFWDFRLRTSSGEYFKIIQQDCALKWSSEMIEEQLLVASKIDSFISFDFQHLRLTNGAEDFFYKYDQKKKEVILLENLSNREMEIAKLIAQSKSLKEIAVDLKISFNTVKAHSYNMIKKLQVTNSLEMINILRTWGFI